MTFDDPILLISAAHESIGIGADEKSIDDLIQEITAVHHARLRGQVLRIDQIVRDMTDHGNTCDPALAEIQQLVQGLSACVDSQLTTEEQVVFPMLRRLQHQTQVTKCRAGMIQSRVVITEREFARIRGVMLCLRGLAEEYASPNGPCEACHELLRVIEVLLSDLRAHAGKELGVLYRWAVARERMLTT